MKKAFTFFLILTIWFFGACAPKKPLPQLPQPEEAQKIQLAAEKMLFDKAEALYADERYEAAGQHYMEYLQLSPGGENAVAALMRLAEIDTIFNEFGKARDVYRQLIDGYPEDPRVADAMLGMLEAFNAESLFNETIRYSFEIPENILNPEQQSQRDILLGDAYLATGSSADAFYFYSLVYNRSTGPAQEFTLTKLKEVLPSLNMVQADHLLDRLTDPVLRGHMLYHTGLLNIEGGRTEYAIKALSELVAAYPDHERAPSAADLLKEIFLSAIESPYTIGCMLPLSGPYKMYGNRALEGIELALNEYNTANPHTPIHIIVKDTASDPFQAVQAVQEFDGEKVAAIIGPIITAEPAAYEAQSRGIPIILFTQKENITQYGDFIFRNFITPDMQVKAIASHAVKKLGLRRFALLYPDENYGITFMNLFWDAVLSLGANVAAVESYDPEQTDFAEPIKKLVGLFYDVPQDIEISFEMLPEASDEIDLGTLSWADPYAFYPDYLKKNTALFYHWRPLEQGPLATEDERKSALEENPVPIVDFDAVFIPDAPKKAGLIIPQLAYYDIEDVVLIGTNLWHSKDLLEMAGQYIQGAVLPDGFLAESDASHVQEFTQTFKRTFGKTPGFIEAVAYDSTGILLQVLRQTDIHFKSQLKDELLNLVDFQGVTGRTSFDYRGDALKKLYILQIRGNRFMEIEIP